MQYEKPELTELSPAIVAIETCKCDNFDDASLDAVPAYEDWEE